MELGFDIQALKAFVNLKLIKAVVIEAIDGMAVERVEVDEGVAIEEATAIKVVAAKKLLRRKLLSLR